MTRSMTRSAKDGSLRKFALVLMTAAGLALMLTIPASGFAMRARIIVNDHAITLPKGGLQSGIDAVRIQSFGHQAHHLVFWRLKPGTSYAHFDSLLRSNTGDPQQVSTIEGGNGPLPPGTAGDFYLVLPAGRYAITDLVHGNVTTELHAQVAKSGTHQTPPGSIGTVDAKSGVDRYQVPKKFGRPGVYEFRNLDRDTHEASIVRLSPGKTVRDLINWAKHPNGPPPAEPLGGFGALHGHGHGWFVLPRLPHGHYALVCFFPNAMGVPHLAMGMAAGFSR